MTDHAGAVERVRLWAEYEHNSPDTVAVSSPLVTFTAGDLRTVLSALSASEARLRVVVEALRPFALAADNMDGDEPDSLFIYDSPESAMIDYSDLRRARQALATIEGEG